MAIDPLALIAALAVMATVIVVVYALYGSTAGGSGAVRNRLQGLMAGTSVIESTVPGGALRGSDDGPGLFARIVKADVSEKLALELERADLTLRPGEYIVLRLVLALVGGVAPIFLLGTSIMGIVAAVVAGVVGYNLPKLYMNRRRKGRVSKLNAQLPEALTMISNSLKAGFGLLQSLNMSAEQLDPPIASEFARTVHEMNIGSSVDEAMLAFSERAGSYDLDIVVTAILVQRTVGGNLGEILDTVAGTMRERIRIRGEIQTLTAQQKLTGVVIGLLPLGCAVIFQVLSPGYMDPLWTTTIGKGMIGVAVVMETIGILVIQRILNIEV